MLAEVALAAAMASHGANAWAIKDAQARAARESILARRVTRVSLAMVDYGVTEYSLRDPHIGEANPLAQHGGIRLAMQGVRVLALAEGLERLERYGVNRRVVKSAEGALMARDAFLVANNVLVLTGHDLKRQTLTMGACALAGAVVGWVRGR